MKQTRKEIIEHMLDGACDDVLWSANDQRIKSDNGKPKITLVPTQIIYDIAEVREYGNNKYPEGGKDNWKHVDVQRYRDALCRHILAYIEDPEGVDEESGIEHYKHAACNLAFIAWFENLKKDVETSCEKAERVNEFFDKLEDVMFQYGDILESVDVVIDRTDD